MLNAKQKYDLIIVDVFSAVRSIPMNFVTADFFRMVKDRLKPNGIMVANVITSPSFGNDFSRGLDNTLRQVFPQYLDRRVLQPYNPYGRDLANVEYVYYNYPSDKTVYTQDKMLRFTDSGKLSGSRPPRRVSPQDSLKSFSSFPSSFPASCSDGGRHIPLPKMLYNRLKIW